MEAKMLSDPTVWLVFVVPVAFALETAAHQPATTEAQRRAPLSASRRKVG
jgi:hypothetical protein